MPSHHLHLALAVGTPLGWHVPNCHLPSLHSASTWGLGGRWLSRQACPPLDTTLVHPSSWPLVLAAVPVLLVLLVLLWPAVSSLLPAAAAFRTTTGPPSRGCPVQDPGPVLGPLLLLLLLQLLRLALLLDIMLARLSTLSCLWLLEL